MDKGGLFVVLVLCICVLAEAKQSELPMALERLNTKIEGAVTFNQGELVDVNGDGLVDAVYSLWFDFDGSNRVEKIYMNDGKGNWIDGDDWIEPAPAILSTIKDGYAKNLMNEEQYMKLVDLLIHNPLRYLLATDTLATIRSLSSSMLSITLTI